MGHRPLPLPATRARLAAFAKTTTPGMQQEQRGCREDDCRATPELGVCSCADSPGNEDKIKPGCLLTLYRGYGLTKQAIRPSRSVALSASDNTSRPSMLRLLRETRDRTAGC